MSKFCPELKRKVLYLDCLECETKSCEETFSRNRNFSGSDNNVNVKNNQDPKTPGLNSRRK